MKTLIEESDTINKKRVSWEYVCQNPGIYALDDETLDDEIYVRLISLENENSVLILEDGEVTIADTKYWKKSHYDYIPLNIGLQITFNTVNTEYPVCTS